MERVYHRAGGNYCYALDCGTLRISILTGEDASSVCIVWGDPYTAGIAGAGGGGAWAGETVPMVDRREMRDGSVWWSIDVKPPFKRCRYFFRIADGGEELLYLEDGFHPMSDMGTMDCVLNAFVFPWMNEADIAVVPAWAGETVWYQIFPARFCRGRQETDAPLLPWAPPSHPVNNNERYGGDIAGMTGRLDYLAELGITGVYLTPVNVAPSQHKYDTTDYLDIDKDFGTREDMRRFVDEAHRRGIKVMLDGVFNHVGRNFFAWRDVLEKRGASEYKDWFLINDMGFDEQYWYNAAHGKYYSFGFHDGMPKLNTNNPQVCDYVCSVVEKWISDYDIDALRLDVANEISHALCRKLREHLKKVKADFYIVGEIWHNALPWLEGDQFDAVMNYPLSNAILRFASCGDGTASLEQDINCCLTNYSAQVTGVLLNQLDSHDTIRAVTRLGSKDKTLQCLVLLFCLPGAACIYYGTEVLLEGGYDPDCRRCMPWAEIDSGEYNETLGFVRDVIRIRHEVPAMRAYNTRFVHETGERVVHIVKTLEDAGSAGGGSGVCGGSGESGTIGSKIGGRGGADGESSTNSRSGIIGSCTDDDSGTNGESASHTVFHSAAGGYGATMEAIFNFGNADWAATLPQGSTILLSRGLMGEVLHTGGLVLFKNE